MTNIEHLKRKEFSAPTPQLYHDKEAGVLDVSWNLSGDTWAILEVGENPGSDFSFCAHGPGGKIKMQGAATIENIDVVVDFAMALMKN